MAGPARFSIPEKLIGSKFEDPPGQVRGSLLPIMRDPKESLLDFKDLLPLHSLLKNLAVPSLLTSPYTSFIDAMKGEGDPREHGASIGLSALGLSAPAGLLSKPSPATLRGLYAPEKFISERGLDIASDASLRIPTGEVLRPIQSRQNFDVFAGGGPLRDVPGGTLHPDIISKVPELNRALVSTRSYPDPRALGSFNPSTWKTGINERLSPAKQSKVAEHEINHVVQGISKMSSIGANDQLTMGLASRPGPYANSQLRGATTNMLMDTPSMRPFTKEMANFNELMAIEPQAAYSGNLGEVIARIGETPGIPPTSLHLEKLFQTQSKPFGINIPIRLTSTGQTVLLPAEVVKKLIFKDGKVLSQSGQQIGTYGHSPGS